MKLIVHECASGETLYQEITATANTNVIAVRPRIYKHNSPAGTLKIQITDTDDNLIAESESITITDISTYSFSHSYVRFYIDAALISGTTYRIHLVNSGYTFNESAYCGWCKTLDLKKYDCNYSPSLAFNSALDVEIWERKNA